MNLVRHVFLCFFLFGVQSIFAQNLFYQECFIGGVTAAGRTSLGVLDGKFKIKWEDSNTLRRAFILTYRYGYPKTTPLTINDNNFEWNYSSQVGPELVDGLFTQIFAVHIQDITESLTLTNDSITVYMEGADLTNDIINQGWWSIMCVFLYESPDISQETCLRIYTADQAQTDAQVYSISTPSFNPSNDVGFSIYSDRISDQTNDGSLIGFNSQSLGLLFGADATNPGSGPFIGGVRGHFYYENNSLVGLDDDVANTSVNNSDGIAVLNGYLENSESQELFLSSINQNPNINNPHPAFFLTYTPDCAVLPDLGSMQRTYDYCRGDTVQLSTTLDYDTFSWSTSTGISDSTLSNPICFADSSQWYTVTMWNEGEEGCSQTIPIFVEVNAIPRPANLNVNPSSCPDNSGLIQANNPAGRSPFSYRLDGVVQSGSASAGLSPRTYDYRINSAAGCRWDTTVTVPLDPLQEASFDPFPTAGFSPLFVAFANTSTQATDYQWLIDGVPVSTSEDITYTFPDSGSFEVSLIAYRLEETCADTATFTLRVEPGIQVLMPNIITPNGDGRNDVLVAQVQGIASCRWVIYNRWGNEVASGEDNDVFQTVELWQPESEVTAGQYTVVLVAEGLAGQVERFTFTVTVAR